MGIHLLIIEPDHRFRLNLSQRLHMEGFEVSEITQPADIGHIIHEKDIDVVLLGLDGLGREGLALIRTIKVISPPTEIILINDALQMDLSIEGMKLGAFDDFLIPLDIDSLVIRIHEAAGRQRKKGKRKKDLSNPSNRGGRQL